MSQPELRNDLAIRDLAAVQLTKRMAFAVTLTFAAAEYNDRQFSFLAAFLAVQLLAAMPLPPKLVQAIVLPGVMAASTAVVQILSVFFVNVHFALIAIVGLGLLLTFYALRRGVPSGLVLFIQMPFCFVPVLSTIDNEVPATFSEDLVFGCIIAVAAVFLSHLLFPSPLTEAQVASARKKSTGLDPDHAFRVAVSDTIILLPLVVWFNASSRSDNIVILMSMLSLLRAVQPGMAGKMAIGMLVGNVIGGVIAVLLYQFIILSDFNFLLFVLSLFGVSLWFSSHIAWGGERATIYAVAFGTFLLIFGLGIAPLFGNSEELVFVRVAKIALASLYTIGALSLVMPLRRERVLSELEKR